MNYLDTWDFTSQPDTSDTCSETDATNIAGLGLTLTPVSLVLDLKACLFSSALVYNNNHKFVFLLLPNTSC